MPASIMRVLVANEEPEIARVIVDALRGFYEVFVARDSDEVLASLAGGGFFLAYIGASEKWPACLRALDDVHDNNLDTKIIAVLNRPDMTLEADLLKKGAVASITYPFSPRVISIIAARERKNYHRLNQVSDLVDSLKSLYLAIIGYKPSSLSRDDISRAVKNVGDPLLIIGERGVGKELLARIIHLSGRRALGPFEVINSRSTAKDELGRELFGFQNNPGALDRARGGSLLIHATGEIPMTIQERLLDIIRDGRMDVRFIFTTRIDLHGAALREEFMPELWALVESSALSIPPLRERPDDIPGLARRLLEQYAARLDSPARDIHRSAIDLLTHHKWAGNLTELERIMLLATARASGPLLVADDLVEIKLDYQSLSLDQFSLEEIIEHKLKPLVATIDEMDEADLYELVLSNVERPLIRLVMNQVGGNQIKAARALGIHRNTLRSKLQKLGIKIKGDF